MSSFTVELDPLSSRNGWLHTWVVLDEQRIPMDASSVFSPVTKLLLFARAIAFNQPYSFRWDAEGDGLEFSTFPIAPDYPEMRVQIKPFSYAENPCDYGIQFDADVNRQETARQLVNTLRGFALDCLTARTEWELPYFLIETLEKELTQAETGGLSDDELHATHFVFGCGDAESHYPPAFNIWVNYDLKLHVSMGDIPRFWYGWFEILENVKNGDLPCEFVFHVEAEDQDDPGSVNFVMNPLGLDVSRHVFCEAAQLPQLFRLKVTHWVALLETEEISVDEVLDRRQFVDDFVKGFTAFLAMDYPAFQESGECQFDLRTLPLNRLTV